MTLSPRIDRIATASTLVVPMLIYIPLAAICCYAYRDRLNIDLTAYLRQSIYLARGDFWSSVSGYWSPLLSWSITPLVAAGFDALRASKVVHATCGAAYLIAVWYWLGKLPHIKTLWRGAAVSLLALATARAAVNMVTPDLLLCALLFTYFAVTLRDDFLIRPRTAILAGAIGGVAYLAKSYAMPFFLVHFPIACFIAWKRAGASDAAIARPVRALLYGMTTWLLVVTPWIVVLSIKYHRFTVNTVGGIAHAIVGPDVPYGRHTPIFFGAAPPPYFSRNEVPDAFAYPTWSPFASGKNLRYQGDLILTNLRAAEFTYWNIDRVGLTLPILLIGAIACFLGLPKVDRAAIVWIVVTAIIYVGGFMTVFFADRYTNPIVLPFTLALAGLLTSIGSQRIRSHAATARWVTLGVVMVSFAALSGPAVSRFLKFSTQREYRPAAAALRQLRLPGPVASSTYNWGLFVSFHANKSYIGFPQTNDPAEANNQLAEIGVLTLIVWDLHEDMDKYDAASSNTARRMVESPEWKRVGGIRAGSDKTAGVYVPAN